MRRLVAIGTALVMTAFLVACAGPAVDGGGVDSSGVSPEASEAAQGSSSEDAPRDTANVASDATAWLDASGDPGLEAAVDAGAPEGGDSANVGPGPQCDCTCDNGAPGFKPQCAAWDTDASPPQRYCSSNHQCVAFDFCCYCQCSGDGGTGYRPQCGGGWDPVDGGYGLSGGLAGGAYCYGTDPCVRLDSCSFPDGGGAPSCSLSQVCGL